MVTKAVDEDEEEEDPVDPSGRGDACRVADDRRWPTTWWPTTPNRRSPRIRVAEDAPDEPVEEDPVEEDPVEELPVSDDDAPLPLTVSPTASLTAVTVPLMGAVRVVSFSAF